MNPETAKEILRLLSSFAAASHSVSNENIKRMIEIAEGYPITLISRVVSRFERGEIEGQSLEYPPKIPQWSVALRKEPRVDGEQGYESPQQFRRRMIAENTVIIHRRKPEERERMLALLRKYKQNRGELIDTKR